MLIYYQFLACLHLFSIKFNKNRNTILLIFSKNSLCEYYNESCDHYHLTQCTVSLREVAKCFKK
jgi:hypothetical protein